MNTARFTRFVAIVWNSRIGTDVATLVDATAHAAVECSEFCVSALPRGQSCARGLARV